MKKARPAPERCGARSRSTGEPCRSWKLVGGKRCKFHGGATQAAKRAAERRLADMRLQSVFAELDLRPVENPLDALRELASEVTAWKNIMSAHVGRILYGDPTAPNDDLYDQPEDDEEDDDGEKPERAAPREPDQIRYRSYQGGEQIRGEVLLFERAMDRCVHTLGVIAKLNIDDRLAAITERQADIIERAVLAMMDDLGMDSDSQKQALRRLSAHLAHDREQPRMSA